MPPDRYVSRRIDISASMNASLRARNRLASRSCALNPTITFIPSSISMRKLPTSALRSRTPATAVSRRDR